MENYKIIVISGKRCSGKDFLAEKLISDNRLSKYNLKLASLADNVKKLYAEKHSADYDKLLTNREYKEQHRQGLIDFSQNEKIQYGNNIWIKRLLTTLSNNTIYIITDCRFKIELSELHPILSIRITASNAAREGRGWVPNEFVDTNISEVDLDDSKFDINISNNSTDKSLNIDNIIEKIYEQI